MLLEIICLSWWVMDHTPFTFRYVAVKCVSLYAFRMKWKGWLGMLDKTIVNVKLFKRFFILFIFLSCKAGQRLKTESRLLSMWSFACSFCVCICNGFLWVLWLAFFSPKHVTKYSKLWLVVNVWMHVWWTGVVFSMYFHLAPSFSGTGSRSTTALSRITQYQRWIITIFWSYQLYLFNSQLICLLSYLLIFFL